ncbi:MAG: hypothetical protein AABX66_04205 [Nanoarchaeota archaeon]
MKNGKTRLNIEKFNFNSDSFEVIVTAVDIKGVYQKIPSCRGMNRYVLPIDNLPEEKLSPFARTCLLAQPFYLREDVRE